MICIIYTVCPFNNLNYYTIMNMNTHEIRSCINFMNSITFGKLIEFPINIRNMTYYTSSILLSSIYSFFLAHKIDPNVSYQLLKLDYDIFAKNIGIESDNDDYKYQMINDVLMSGKSL